MIIDRDLTFLSLLVKTAGYDINLERDVFARLRQVRNAFPLV
jgi:hypothetical protein